MTRAELADEIADAAVRAAREGAFWAPTSDRAFAWCMRNLDRWGRLRCYARDLLDARAGAGR